MKPRQLTSLELVQLGCRLCARMHLVIPWPGKDGRKNAQAAWWGREVTSHFRSYHRRHV